MTLELSTSLVVFPLTDGSRCYASRDIAAYLNASRLSLLSLLVSFFAESHRSMENCFEHRNVHNYFKSPGRDWSWVSFGSRLPNKIPFESVRNAYFASLEHIRRACDQNCFTLNDRELAQIELASNKRPVSIRSSLIFQPSAWRPVTFGVKLPCSAGELRFVALVDGAIVAWAGPIVLWVR